MKSNSQTNKKYSVGVLLIHGMSGMPAEMRPVSKHLESLGYKTLTPKLPGHGGTQSDLLSKTWQDFLDALEGAVETLSAECDQVFTCGLSMGGILGALLAAEQKVQGIIMLSPALYFDMHSHPIMQNKLVLAFMYWLVGFKFIGHNLYWTEKPPYGLKDERLQRIITKQIEAASRGESNNFGLFRKYWSSLREIYAVTNHFLKNAHKINCPALIIHSHDDTLTSIRNATDAYNMLASQDKSLVLLTGCDHVVTLDLCKDLVAAQVERFVALHSENKGTNQITTRQIPSESKTQNTVQNGLPILV